MKEETTRLSASLEDYLKEIYLLNLEGQEVRITDIARSLGISKCQPGHEYLEGTGTAGT